MSLKLNSNNQVKRSSCIKKNFKTFSEKKTMMILRNLQAYRSIIQSNRFRLFSLTKVSCSSIPEQLPSNSQEKSKLVLSTQKSMPALNSLPSYLPEPRGVQSKLFDKFYVIYRLGFHQPLRMIQLIKMMQMMSA